MNKMSLYSMISILICSCGSNVPKENNSVNNTATVSDLSSKGITDSFLVSTNENIKGIWIDGETTISFVNNNIYVVKSGDNVDSSFYSISYKSCEADSSVKPITKDIIYLKITSKETGQSCLSIENVTGKNLTLMTLANGSIWTLSRKR